jgi:hypothetical protein
MRKALRHWFRPTEAEERELWANGIFSFDASVLLNIYGYSGETRNELVNLIKNNSDRIRLPHQFGLEYARNRSVVIMKQVSNYRKAEETLEHFRESQIDPKRDHPYLTEESLRNLEAIMRELSDGKKELEKLIKCDPYADTILAAFEGKLGPTPSSEDLTKLHEEAQRRYDRKCPPGYADLGEKGIPDAYGDYVGWSQLIEMARTDQKDVVFVTDDSKEDWWTILRGEKRDRTIGPRPELIEEFFKLANQRLWIYRSENFLRAAKIFADAQIRDEAIEEIKQRLASQRELRKALADLKSTPSESQTSKVERESPDAGEASRKDTSRSPITVGDSEKSETPTVGEKA